VCLVLRSLHSLFVVLFHGFGGLYLLLSWCHDEYEFPCFVRMSGVDIVMWLSLAVVHYGMCGVRLHRTGCMVGEDRTGVDDHLHCMDGIPRFCFLHVLEGSS
jgi:hypothetical protein